MEKPSQYYEKREEYESICPVCHSTIKIIETIYQMPKIGWVLIVSFKCNECGFKKTDTLPLQLRNHRRIYLRIEDKADLYTKLVRSSSASIFIPELGVEIRPGPITPFTITNVEGLLHRVLDALKSLEVLGEEVNEDVRAMFERIIDEGGEITIIIDDPWGISMIEPIGPGGGKIIMEEVEGEVEEKWRGKVGGENPRPPCPQPGL